MQTRRPPCLGKSLTNEHIKLLNDYSTTSYAAPAFKPPEYSGERRECNRCRSHAVPIPDLLTFMGLKRHARPG